MADRKVTLGVGVETTGEEGLKTLAGDLRGIGTAAEGTAGDTATLARQLDALAAATRERRTAEGAARAEAAAARAELNAQADALARLRAGADAATRGTAEFTDRERALRVAVTEARIALRDKNATAAAAATEAKAAAAAESQLRDQMERTARATVTNTTAVTQAMGSVYGQLSMLRNVATAAVGGTFLGALAKDVNQTAEAYQNLSAHLRIASADEEQFKANLQGVFDVANRTGVSVEEVGTLVTRLIASGKELGLTNQQALGLAESLTQALRLGGASAQEAASAVLQFSQAMASGRLAGDELRSILESAPRLAQALAAGLGVSIGQLKELGAAGALTSQQVVAAIQGQGAALQAEFDRMPATVSRAMATLSNAWTQYVGRLNEGSGATATAAGAIEALARNLGTVADLLYAAGKAGAAFYAVKLAGAFLESATAARAAAAATAAATAATTAHTAATAANTTAQGANAAATAGAAASAGRFAAAVANIKLTVFAAVLTSAREIGTVLGEGAAKLAGWGKASAELEAAQQREAEATRRNATEKAALAQRTQQAADAALGLGKEARALVSEFDGVLLKSNDTGEALAKLAKELRLSDVSGITAAGAALDALAQRGKITAAQVQEALSAALKGDDLARFEVMARAAFDGSTQGARRLQAALDAVADESLRRAGTSAQELATGFSAAATSAVNDVDALATTLRNLKAPAEESGRALSASLDKALQAANTSRAVEGVIDRIQALGREGLLTGDQLAATMEKARKKTEELTPGINSVAEAMRTLGLKSAEESQRIAENFRQAWERIKNDGTLTLQQKIEAFQRYRDAAIAANGGVESSEVALQRKMLELQADARGLGDEFERSMGRAAAATRKATEALTDQRAVLTGIRNDSAGANSSKPAAGDPYGRTQEQIDALKGQGGPVDASYQFLLAEKLQAGTLTAADLPGALNALRVAKENAVSAANSSVPSLTGQADAMNWVNTLQQVVDKLQGKGLGGGGNTGVAGGLVGSTSHTVNINLGGRSTTINTASAGDASALAGVLRDLEDSARQTL